MQRSLVHVKKCNDNHINIVIFFFFANDWSYSHLTLLPALPVWQFIMKWFHYLHRQSLQCKPVVQCSPEWIGCPLRIHKQSSSRQI